MLDRDTTKPTKKLLADIMSAAVNQSHMPGLVLVPFATLLVRLSEEASQTTNQNMKIQSRMIVLTSIILGITIVQLLVAIISAIS